MKTLKIILTSTLLLSVTTLAMTSKVNEENKKVYKVLEGDSKSQVSKRGLAVDMSYKSEHVDVGDLSSVNITLTTSLSTGNLKVKVTALDNKLEGINEKNLEFKLSNANNTFPIDLEVSSKSEGVQYINLVVSVADEGARVFVVPVNIGTISTKIENKALDITKDGTAISVANADEELK
jgi:uncharacterized protein YjaZ